MQFAMLALAVATQLSPSAQQTVARLEHVLMAPCCYTQTIDEHRSEVAAEMRQEVESMVAAGKSEQQIKDYYVAKYGATILVVPEGRTGAVAYGVPVGLAAAALLLLTAVLRRRMLQRGLAGAGTCEAADMAQTGGAPEHAPGQAAGQAVDPRLERLRHELD